MCASDVFVLDVCVPDDFLSDDCVPDNCLPDVFVPESCVLGECFPERVPDQQPKILITIYIISFNHVLSTFIQVLGAAFIDVQLKHEPTELPTDRHKYL